VIPDGRRRAARAALLVTAAAALAACGGTGTLPPSSAASTPTPSGPTPTAAAAHAQCPSGTTIGSALGIALPNPVSVANGDTGPPLPGGATGMGCEYHGTSDNVIIEFVTNISPSYISQFSAHFPGGYKTVSGVGDQARYFSQPLGGGKDNEGVVAVKGSTIVAIDATDTPASLAQLESLVNQLL
jgi:hypothetical protein